MSDAERFEVRFANGETEEAEALWGGRHAIARGVAFAAEPARPLDALPARIDRLGRQYVGGRSFLKEVLTANGLTAIDGEEPR